MKNKLNDGIVFDSTVYLSEEGHRKLPIYMRFLQGIAIVIGGYCFISIIVQCFRLQIINSVFVAAVILLSLVYHLILLFPAFDFVKLLSTLVIYGGVIYYWRKQLENGFYVLENAVIERASAYYNFPVYRFIADYSTAERDITFLLIVIVTPVVGILAISLLRGKLKLLVYAVVIIPMVISFVMGVTPAEVDMIAYILVLLFVFISNGFSNSEASLRNTFGKLQKSMLYRISIRIATIFCLLALILFLMVKQFVPVDKYEAYDGITEAKTNIQSFMMDFSFEEVSNKFSDLKLNIGSNKRVATGGLSLGKLGRADSVSYDETEHLQIKVPLKSVLEGIYLKGYVGSVYTGDSWDTHTRQIKDSYNKLMDRISLYETHPAIGSGLLLSKFPYSLFVDQGRAEITYKNANRKYVYAPSFTSFKNNNNVGFDYDLGVTSDKGLKDINLEYSYNLSNLIQNDYFTTGTEGSNIKILLEDDLFVEDDAFLEYTEFEREYRSFVYEAYTKLPEQGLDRLKYDFSRDQVGIASENLQDAIAYVKAYLDRYTRYTLSPGKLPKDKDFVEYFLYESKIGYCTHYASAGALMLRAMGYPARYVEGYAVSRSDLLGQDLALSNLDRMVDITVKDYNAHAWVEVYYDGFGWVPIEFTSSAGMEDMAQAVEGLGRLLPNTRDSPTNTPTPSPLPTDKPVEDVKPTQSAAAQDVGNLKDKGKITKDSNKLQEVFIWYLLIVPALIIVVGILLYILYLSKRRKKIAGENYSKRALRIYRRIEWLFKISWGLPKRSNRSNSLEDNEEYIKKNYSLLAIDEFERCMEIIRKDRFAKEPISQKEYMTVERFYNDLWDQAYKRIPYFKRLLLKLYFI